MLCSPSFLRRLLVKIFRITIIERPPKEWMKDAVKDSLMALHFCRTCKAYRYDRHFDLISRNSHLICEGCGTRKKTSDEGIGLLFMRLKECGRAATLEQARRKSKSKIMFVARFFQYLIFGLGKYLPPDRGGKTAGELERETHFEIITATLFLDKSFYSPYDSFTEK